MQSPLINLPDEFILELYNSNDYRMKVGELSVSVRFNKIKFAIYENLNLKNTLEYLTDVFVEDMKNKSLNGGNNAIHSGEDSATIKDSNEIINMIIDFNKNASISIISKLGCQYDNLSQIENINVKLLLASYDLLTYFKDNSKYYEYIYSDFLPFKYNLRKNFSNGFKIMLDFINSNKNKNVGHQSNSPYIIFRVNKSTIKLDEININFQNNDEIFNFKPVLSKKIPNESVFNNNKNECSLLKDGDSNEILLKILRIIIRNVIKK